jgi:hypothetical protein
LPPAVVGGSAIDQRDGAVDDGLVRPEALGDVRSAGHVPKAVPR